MPEASLSCYTRREGRSLIFALEGTLDLATAPQALETLQAFLAEHGPELVVDTSRLDFIDSKGVGALLTVAKAARDAGGAVYLPHAALPVRKILEACGLSSLFPAEPPARPDAPPAPAKPAAPKPAGRTIVGRAATVAEEPAAPAVAAAGRAAGTRTPRKAAS